MMPAYGRVACPFMEDPRPHRRIYAVLVTRIGDGTYAPGARLNIGLLADEFHVTRTTIGKALRLLEQDGRIVMYRGLGWYVRD
jgi:DNA-binding GntR family transcriptional regulator